VAVTAALSCGGSSGSPAAAPTPPIWPPDFDVTFGGSSPPPGGTLVLTPPNNTPVALSVTFSVSVPLSYAGTVNWNTAVQAVQPLGWTIVPVVTSAFRPVTLAPGVHTLTLTDFHTTNAICYNLDESARVSTSLDIDVRDPSAGVRQRGSQLLGKRFEVAYTLECQ
jgi:hypothetical protein